MLGSSVLRAALASFAIVVVAGALMWEFGPNNSIGFLRMKIVNDTNRTVKIQPCWDIGCNDVRTLPAVIVHPGERSKVAGKSPNDYWQWVTVAVLEPDADESGRNWDGCLLNSFPPHLKVGVLFVSNEVKCPVVPAGGAGGF